MIDLQQARVDHSKGTAQAALADSSTPSATSRAEEAQSLRKRESRIRSDLRSLGISLRAILVLLVLGVCYLAQEILIPIILALLVSLLLSPVVTFLERSIRVPRALGSLLTLAVLVSALVFGVMEFRQPAQQWIANAPATIQIIQDRFRMLREPMRQAQEAGRKIDDLTRESGSKTVVTTQSTLLSHMISSTPRALGAVGAVLLMAYFFLSSGNAFLRRSVEVAPSLSDKKVIVSIARDVQEEMSRYLVMVSLINLGLGAATAMVMGLIGVPNPLLWGAVASLLNFAPYVGPLCTCLALAVAGFTTFDSLGHALAVPGAFVVLASIEGQLITPTIIGRRLSLDPTVVFIWLLLWGWLWGGVGVLLAGPLLACFRIICQHVRSLQFVGALIGYAGVPSNK